MSRFKWHVSRKNETPKIVRHYKHVTKMFDFILRNPAMFRSKELTIYNHGEIVADISWDRVSYLDSLDLKERKMRNVIRGLESEEE